MADDPPKSPAEFRRLVPARELSAARPRRLSAEADETERAALAALLDLAELASLRFAGELIPEAGGIWRLTGRVTARLTQTCVVTLAPIRAEIDEPVDRRYGLDGPDDDADLDFDPEADDPPDPIGAGVDYGATAVEALSLALDPYPRAPDAVFEPAAAAPPGAEPLTPEAAKPFAALAALKKTMENGD